MDEEEVLMEIEELAIKRGLAEARKHACHLIESTDISRVIAEELLDAGFISNDQFQETMGRIKRKRELQFSDQPTEEELARSEIKKKKENAAQARREAAEQKKKDTAVRLTVQRRLDGERQERIRLREYDGVFEIFINDCSTNNIEGVKVALAKHANEADDITNRQLSTSISGSGGARWAACTGLMVASRFGHSDLVKLLLSAQFNTLTALQDKSGRCTLHWAAEFGHTAVIKALHACDHNILDTTGSTALMLAVRGDHFDAVTALLLNSDINVLDKTGSTALMQACDQGNPKITRKLLDYSAEIDAVNVARRTALMHCARWGHAKVCEVVLDRDPDVNMRDRFGWTALMLASRWNKLECVVVILENDPKLDVRDRQLGRTALIWASYKSHFEIVVALIEAGADPLVKDINGNRAVDLAGSVQVIAVLNDAMAGRADANDNDDSDDSDDSDGGSYE